MKVSQRIVTDKLTELKRVRNDLRKDENAEISKTLDPNDVYERIADNRGLHARVEAATRIYATASWTAQLFSFEVQVNE